MARLKKAFAWLFGDFSSTLMFCWLPLLVVQDFLHTDYPDDWDYGIAIINFVALALILVTDIVGYRRKIAKKNI